ncbi:S1 family peptidase [Nonomuraea pusilla]|uniref:Trypsin-like peptidase domain-containing protein n=1 Tax=Nonomuraea pusilla TaxID=46177 RepID=A0A1H8CGP8_9ACTN|nr:serine protease [Nonomuraea pusilla]SEM94461.1 Trypsin-like peptidase domain-containing protein [Nonomuraea pusilla]
MKIAAAAAVVMAVALPASPAVADGSPDERPDVPVGTWLAARTQPAVQMTSFTYTGTVAVPTSTINQTAFQELVQQATATVASGKISSDERSIAKWLFQRIAADVDTYLTSTTPERTVEAEVGGLCTGWWVTPDGYMVTGAHCVQVGETELSQLFAKQALTKFNEQDAKEIISGLQGLEADEEILKLAQQIYITFNTNHMTIRGLKQSLSVLQSLPGGGVDKTAKAVPAELVSVGESYPGKDFALLKVNGQQNLPTVPLGEDADVRTGDTLYISGFPGLVTNTPFFSLESRLEPALTEGPYNAKRSTQTGVPYIQTQAPSYHGNSGGPVFSKDGKVIGMLIAGTVSETGESSESESFVLPVSIIKEKLGEKNVKPAQALTTTRYNEALNDYFRHYYEDALPKFREVQALFPNHPYVAKYISDSQQAISAGKDESPKPILMWVLIAAGVIVAIVVILVLVKVLRERRRPQPQPAYPSPAPVGAYGAVSPPPWQQQQLPPGQGHVSPPAQPAHGAHGHGAYGQGGPGGYGSSPYGSGQQNGNLQHGGDQYGSGQHGAGQYGGDQYGGQYGGAQHGPDQYGGQYGGQYGPPAHGGPQQPHGQAQPPLGDRTRNVRYGQFSPPPNDQH